MKVSNTQTISSKTNQFLKIATKIPKTRKTLTRSWTIKENQIKVKKTKQKKIQTQMTNRNKITKSS